MQKRKKNNRTKNRGKKAKKNRGIKENRKKIGIGKERTQTGKKDKKENRGCKENMREGFPTNKFRSSFKK